MAVAAVAVLLLLCPVSRPAAGSGDTTDPFAFYSPFVRLSASDRAKVANGQVLVRALPADDGHIAVFAASRLAARPDALIEWTREIEALKRGPLVMAAGRFSTPPRVSDLDALTLDQGDLDALRHCQPGDCAVKLAGAEITALRRAASNAPGGDWRTATQEEFRRLMVARVRLHRDLGLAALPPYADKGKPVALGAAFATILQRSPYLERALPDVVQQIQSPGGALENSLYYWSTEKYGGRPVISLTYVALLQPSGGPPAPAAMSVSAQLFASHYTEAALGVTAVVCDAAQTSCYLTYLNQTRVDVLGGFFGGLKRALIEQRIESDTPTLLRTVRQRLESGSPSGSRD